MSWRSVAVCVVLALASRTVHAQHLDVSGGGSVTVGDAMTLAFRAELPRGAVPLDAVLHARDTLPSSVRLLGVDTLRPAGSDTEYTARVRIAFYQTGSQSTPAFVLRYRPAGGETADSVVSGAVLMTVVATLPDTAVAMRDIRAVAALGGTTTTSPWLFLAAALVVAALVVLILKARRRRPAVVVQHAAPVTPYDAALAAIDRATRAAPDDVEYVYESVSAAVRTYIHARLGIPAVHRTTRELLSELPPPFAHDGGDRARALLDEADLVKFARLRPDTPRAAVYGANARALVSRWEARARELDTMEAAGAIR